MTAVKGQTVIYRIIGEDERYRQNENGEWIPKTGVLFGALLANFGGEEWADLPAPPIRNPRARFWFTEAGWKKYGRHILAHAMRSGRTYRLLRTKNPPDSAVIYRDPWQIALDRKSVV